MAKKTYRLPITVGVADPDTSVTQLLDKDGRLVRPASIGMRHVKPGDPVEMDESEAMKIIARHGPYKETVIVTQAEVAPDAVQVAATPVSRRGA